MPSRNLRYDVFRRGKRFREGLGVHGLCFGAGVHFVGVEGFSEGVAGEEPYVDRFEAIAIF